MTVNDKRPVNLDLGTIQFPLPAIVSLLHRISGFALFGLIPLLIWAWQYSLSSPENFAELADCTAFKVGVTILLAGLVYHTVAGFRHLIADLGIGESLAASRATAAVTMVLSGAVFIALGVWVWA